MKKLRFFYNLGHWLSENVYHRKFEKKNYWIPGFLLLNAKIIFFCVRDERISNCIQKKWIVNTINTKICLIFSQQQFFVNICTGFCIFILYFIL